MSLFTKLFGKRTRRNHSKATHRRCSTFRLTVEPLEERSLLAANFGTSEWAQWITNPEMKVLSGDFNGDGRTDVMKFDTTTSTGPGGLWVGLSNGSGFDTSEWAQWITSPEMKVLSGDFDGDGRSDVMKFDTTTSTGPGGLWVGLSNGSGFDTSEWAQWITSPQMQVLSGDFNGDGLTDVMKFDVDSSGASPGGLWVGLSNSSGFDTYHWADWITSPRMKVLSGDFNGDGRTDVMKFDVNSSGWSSGGLWVGLSNGSGFDTSEWAQWSTRPEMHVLTGDFNGDGRTDVMKFDTTRRTGGGGLWVGLSNGSGFDTSEWAQWQTSPQMKVLAGDFNGDGRTDVMKFDTTTSTGPGGLWVGLSNGSGFDTSEWSQWITSPQMKVLSGDFNGDGRSDVMKFDIASSTGPGGLWVGLASNTPLQLGGLSASTWTAGESRSATITVDGGTYQYRNLAVSGLPAGLSASLQGTQVVISGTAAQAGTFNGVTVSLQDSRGIAISRRYSLTVNLGLTPGSLSAARAGLSYSSSIRATGGSGSYTYALASGSLPAGMTLSSAGVLSGTATVARQYTFSVRATDAARAGVTGTRSYTLTVDPAAASAVRLTTSATSTTTGGRVTVTVTVEDRFGNRAAHTGSVTIASSDRGVFAALNVSVSNGSGSGTLIASRSGTARISTSAAGIGSNSVTITVSPSLYRYTWELTARYVNDARSIATRFYSGTYANDTAAGVAIAGEAARWRQQLDAQSIRDSLIDVTYGPPNRTPAN